MSTIFIFWFMQILFIHNIQSERDKPSANVLQRQRINLASFKFGNEPNIKHEVDVDSRLKTAKDECVPDQFHPSDILSIIENVEYYQDCVIICRNHPDCTVVTYFSKIHRCLMAGGRLRKKPDTFKDLKETEYCDVYDMTHRKEVKNLTALKPGTASAQCGVPHFSFQFQKNDRRRIMHGGRPKFYSIPWLVQIENSDNEQFCSGSLFDMSDSATETRYIITAAHCVVNLDENGKQHLKRKILFVRAGSYDQRFKEAHEQVRIAVRALVHSAYGVTALDNIYDIAILEVDQPFLFNNYINSICLPELTSEINQHSTCFIAGWGMVSETIYINNSQLQSTNHKYEPYLKAARVNILAYRDDDKWSRFLVYSTKHDSMYGGELGRGDSGGPLFCERLSKPYALDAITSKYNQYRLNYSMYREDQHTKVALLRCWIFYVLTEVMPTACQGDASAEIYILRSMKV